MMGGGCSCSVREHTRSHICGGCVCVGCVCARESVLRCTHTLSRTYTSSTYMHICRMSCEKRRISCEKRRISCEKRRISCEKRRISCEKRRMSCEKLHICIYVEDVCVRERVCVHLNTLGRHLKMYTRLRIFSACAILVANTLQSVRSG